MAKTMPKVASAELNSEILAELNVKPDAEEGEYADLRQAFKSIAIAINEVIYNATYLSDGGFGSSTVVGAAPTVTVTGDFIKGDTVCEYLDSIQYEIGAKRVTDIKLTRNGNVVTCPVTLTGIAISGGESTAPNAVTLTIAFNGKPTLSKASEAVALKASQPMISTVESEKATTKK